MLGKWILIAFISIIVLSASEPRASSADRFSSVSAILQTKVTFEPRLRDSINKNALEDLRSSLLSKDFVDFLEVIKGSCGISVKEIFISNFGNSFKKGRLTLHAASIEKLPSAIELKRRCEIFSIGKAKIEDSLSFLNVRLSDSEVGQVAFEVPFHLLLAGYLDAGASKYWVDTLAGDDFRAYLESISRACGVSISKVRLVSNDRKTALSNDGEVSLRAVGFRDDIYAEIEKLGVWAESCASVSDRLMRLNLSYAAQKSFQFYVDLDALSLQEIGTEQITKWIEFLSNPENIASLRNQIEASAEKNLHVGQLGACLSKKGSSCVIPVLLSTHNHIEGAKLSSVGGFGRLFQAVSIGALLITGNKTGLKSFNISRTQGVSISVLGSPAPGIQYFE